MAELIISGPAGRIEARYTPAPGENPPIALILHPHPKAGGTMQDQGDRCGLALALGISPLDPPGRAGQHHFWHSNPFRSTCWSRSEYLTAALGLPKSQPSGWTGPAQGGGL